MLKEKRRESVLHSAKQLFSQKGYYQTSIADIVQHAGIARGTFYLYFGNKRQVFESILDLLLDEFKTLIRPIELDLGSPPPLVQLRDILRAVIGHALENRELTQILLSRAEGLDREFDHKLGEFYQALLEKIEAALRHGMSLSLVRECDPRVTAHCILGCAKETIALIAAGEESGLQREAILEGVLTFGLQGLLAKRFS